MIQGKVSVAFAHVIGTPNLAFPRLGDQPLQRSKSNPILERPSQFGSPSPHPMGEGWGEGFFVRNCYRLTREPDAAEDAK
jgi:hypothetical protein